MNVLPLASEVVALPMWRWMLGMRDLQGRRISSLGIYPTGIPDGDARVRPDNSVSRQPILPDLTDAATVGCLLSLVREAWGDPSLCVVFDHDDGRWNVGRWEDGLVLRGRGGASEVEALVSALRGAP